MTFKTRINLLQESLVPKKQYLTLKTVLFSWGGLLLMLSTIAWWQAEQVKNLQRDYGASQNANAQQTDMMQQMQSMLAEQKPDTQLVAKLAQLKAVLANKQELVAHLALVDNDAGHGFANVMAELSEFHQSGIRVNQVKLTPSSVTLRGEALHAELVPQWLTGFEDASFLVGMRFADFSIHTNDDNITVFNVSTIASPESK